MTLPLKFLFDECIGKPVMEQIERAVALSLDQSEFAHILDFQKQGELDETWIPRIAQEGCWVVVTSDRGRRGPKKGEKLPLVCKRHAVTHIVLSAAIHRKSSIEKMAVILGVWGEMTKLADAPKGSAHLIRMMGKRPFAPILIQVDPPLPLIAPAERAVKKTRKKKKKRRADPKD